MKIEKVDTELYHVPLSSPMEDAVHGVQRDFSLIVVKIATHGGATGMGYTYSVGQVGGTSIATLIKDNLAPILIGEDPRRIERLWNVWYSKSVGPSQGFGGDVENDKVWPWGRCDIWYATSTDGWTWQEEGIAMPRGAPGAYDDRSVFTAEIMKHGGFFFLCYQVVKSPYTVRIKNQVGLAWVDSPDGPGTKSKEPILSPANNGIWKDQHIRRFSSHRVSHHTALGEEPGE